MWWLDLVTTSIFEFSKVAPQGRRWLLLMLSPATATATVAAAAACTGKYSNLASKQCAAYKALWDSNGGVGWTNQGAGCARADPCGSCPDCITCNAAGTGIEQVCVA